MTTPPPAAPATPSTAGTATTAPVRRELILSEEQLVVSTVRVPARRVRLEKYVVTETRTVTVEVSHEEVRLVDLGLEEVPSDDTPPALGEHPAGDRWLVLSEERIAITTEVVPVERVSLQVTSVLEHRDITDQVRRERVSFDPATPADLHPTHTIERDTP